MPLGRNRDRNCWGVLGHALTPGYEKANNDATRASSQIQRAGRKVTLRNYFIYVLTATTESKRAFGRVRGCKEGAIRRDGLGAAALQTELAGCQARGKVAQGAEAASKHINEGIQASHAAIGRATGLLTRDQWVASVCDSADSSGVQCPNTKNGCSLQRICQSSPNSQAVRLQEQQPSQQPQQSTASERVEPPREQGQSVVGVSQQGMVQHGGRPRRHRHRHRRR